MSVDGAAVHFPCIEDSRFTSPAVGVIHKKGHLCDILVIEGMSKEFIPFVDHFCYAFLLILPLVV